MWEVSSCNTPLLFFFFNDTATTEIYTLSLHDALPIYRVEPSDCCHGATRPRQGHQAQVDPVLARSADQAGWTGRATSCRRRAGTAPAVPRAQRSKLRSCLAFS